MDTRRTAMARGTGRAPERGAHSVVYYLTQWGPRARRGRVFSTLVCAAAAGGAVLGPVSAWIMAGLGGVGGLRSWQWLIVRQGLPEVALGWVVFACVQNRPARASGLTAEQPGELAALLAIKIGIDSGLFCAPTVMRAACVEDYRQLGPLAARPFGANRRAPRAQAQFRSRCTRFASAWPPPSTAGSPCAS